MIRVALSGCDLSADGWSLSEANDRYLRTVRRLGHGAAVRVFDGAGNEAAARLVQGEAGWRLVRAGSVEPGRPAAPITLVYGLPKGDKLDRVTRQITELGAARLVLLACARSVVKLVAERARKRRVRLERIAAEAARQSGRADAPLVEGPFDLTAALDATADHPARWVLDPSGEIDLDGAPIAAPLALFVGPEGGFAPDEIERMTAAGVRPVALACPVLRTETAAPIAVALARHRLGLL